jgi:hypothetical protein
MRKWIKSIVALGALVGGGCQSAELGMQSPTKQAYSVTFTGGQQGSEVVSVPLTTPGEFSTAPRTPVAFATGDGGDMTIWVPSSVPVVDVANNRGQSIKAPVPQPAVAGAE